MKLWHGIFSARKDLQGSFDSYGGPVKLVIATLSVRKTMEKNFHDYRGAVKLVQASLGDRKDVERIFTTLEVLLSLCRVVWVTGKM